MDPNDPFQNKNQDKRGVTGSGQGQHQDNYPLHRFADETLLYLSFNAHTTIHLMSLQTPQQTTHNAPRSRT